MKEYRDNTYALSDASVTSIKNLRSYAGTSNHVANLIAPMRPFLDELWAALCAHDATSRGGADAEDAASSTTFRKLPTRAPPGCVWKSQVEQALHWFRAFLTEVTGPLRRVFTLAAYPRLGQQVDVYTDAHMHLDAQVSGYV